MIPYTAAAHVNMKFKLASPTPVFSSRSNKNKNNRELMEQLMNARKPMGNRIRIPFQSSFLKALITKTAEINKKMTAPSFPKRSSNVDDGPPVHGRFS
jgi:hypothetical protein